MKRQKKEKGEEIEEEVVRPKKGRAVIKKSENSDSEEEAEKMGVRTRSGRISKRFDPVVKPKPAAGKKKVKKSRLIESESEEPQSEDEDDIQKSESEEFEGSEDTPSEEAAPIALGMQAGSQSAKKKQSTLLKKRNRR